MPPCSSDDPVQAAQALDLRTKQEPRGDRPSFAISVQRRRGHRRSCAGGPWPMAGPGHHGGRQIGKWRPGRGIGRLSARCGTDQRGLPIRENVAHTRHLDGRSSVWGTCPACQGNVTPKECRHKFWIGQSTSLQGGNISNRQGALAGYPTRWLTLLYHGQPFLWPISVCRPQTQSFLMLARATDGALGQPSQPHCP